MAYLNMRRFEHQLAGAKEVQLKRDEKSKSAVEPALVAQ
jgi:hypothetical protein